MIVILYHLGSNIMNRDRGLNCIDWAPMSRKWVQTILNGLGVNYVTYLQTHKFACKQTGRKNQLSLTSVHDKLLYNMNKDFHIPYHWYIHLIVSSRKYICQYRLWILPARYLTVPAKEQSDASRGVYCPPAKYAYGSTLGWHILYNSAALPEVSRPAQP